MTYTAPQPQQLSTGYTVGNMLQAIGNLALKNQGGQQSQTGGIGATPQGPAQQRSGGINSSLRDAHILSQLFGYDPQTMFGYNIDGSGIGSTPNSSDLMGMLGVGTNGATAPAVGSALPAIGSTAPTTSIGEATGGSVPSIDIASATPMATTVGAGAESEGIGNLFGSALSALWALL